MAPKSKHPCGGCNKEVTKQTRSLACTICEYWFHYDCVEGMTDEFFESCGQAFQTWGYSAFFCKCCRKATAKMNKAVKELREEIDRLHQRVEVMEKEREQVTRRVDDMEERTERVKADLKGIEKEVTTGMEKAKEEVKRDVRTEMKEIEDRSENVVVYGLEEMDGNSIAVNKEAESRKVRELAKEVGVEMGAEDVEIKFRAGKKREDDDRPRPLIVKINDAEKRDKLRKNARFLARSEEWKKVYVSEDLTWQQREEARKREKELREEADKKTEQAKNEGKEGRWRVVGPRGRRTLAYIEDR